ncbi:Peptidyl-prolyl cis-trans isomerase [Musa troglodytarum]|uniref:Peptidyl-prolyl cis-trans isomerase n=1 Tax=Musa troglodytarum TaxID=320322 RepID=A0A9E7FRB2_9LILI|nr:Peptidyl-prolyl cis-trans isomerase [Musa troglodytarum]
MGRDSKSKDSGGKGKGKQAAASDENASKGKAKGGKSSDGLARHILCEKQGKINEAYKKLQDGWLSNGDKVATEYSECPSGKKGGDLGWFPRGKMAGPFQDVAFSTPVGATSAAFKSTCGDLCSLAVSGALCFVNHGLDNDDEPCRPVMIIADMIA